MSARWYCLIDDREHGPLTTEALKRLAESEKLRPSHMVWREGDPKKRPAGWVKGLFDAAPPPPREEKAEPPMVEVVEDGPRLLAEVPVIYRDGHPDVSGPIGGTLVIESDGLRFVYQLEDEEEEIALPFTKVEAVLEPARGDFPPAMKRNALGAKLGGKAGRMAAGMVGSWLGGVAGDIVEGAGKEASKMAEQGGQLGKPPRNRVAVLARFRKERRKFLFDADGPDREAMNEEAQALYKALRKARDKAAAPPEEDDPPPLQLAPDEPEPEPVAPAPPPVAVQAPAPAPAKKAPVVVAAAPAGAERRFRVMSGGQVRGPYTLEELRGQIDGGKIAATDLIGVEAWLPAGTLGALLGRADAPAAAPPRPADDTGLIQADDEFRLK